MIVSSISTGSQAVLAILGTILGVIYLAAAFSRWTDSKYPWWTWPIMGIAIFIMSCILYFIGKAVYELICYVGGML